MTMQRPVISVANGRALGVVEDPLGNAADVLGEDAAQRLQPGGNLEPPTYDQLQPPGIYPPLTSNSGGGLGGPVYPGVRVPRDGFLAGFNGDAVGPSWFRFGLVDSAIIAVGALTGAWLETKVRPNSNGTYGLLLGAIAGNALADGISTIASSRRVTSGLAAFAGALLPSAPVMAALALGRPLKNGTAVLAISGAIGAIVIGSYYRQIASAVSGGAR